MNRRQPQSLISKQEWRLFGIVTGIMIVISVGITVLATWMGRPEEPKYLLPSQSPFKTSVSDTIPKTTMLTDFALPAAGGQWLSQSWLFSRTGGSRPWTNEEIAPFWTPPSRLEVLQLPQENERKLKKLFGEVP